MGSQFSGKYDVCVIGGGYMGAAASMGLVKADAKVLMLDKVSNLQRASKANFGLIWSQSKCDGNWAYTRLSEKAVRESPQFIDRIEDESGINTEMRLGRGLIVCLGDKELDARSQFIKRMQSQAETHGKTYPTRLLERDELQKLIGKTPLGEKVSGGAMSSIDGDVNPLLLLKALRKIFIERGGRFLHDCEVHGIKRSKGTYCLDTKAGKIETQKVVLAAGHGNSELLKFFGVSSPIIPQKGQLLVTGRLNSFLPFPCSGIRQTACGSVMIGFTNENTGFEVSTTVEKGAGLAKRALKIFPSLAHAKVVRSWAGLRVLTKDGLPVYDEVADNVYLLASHSCVTLASVHEQLLPEWILNGAMAEELKSFQLARFHV